MFWFWRGGRRQEEAKGKQAAAKKTKKSRKKHGHSGEPPKRYTPEEKLNLIQEFDQSGLPAKTFADWYGVSAGALKTWKERYKAEGLEGLKDRPRTRKRRLPEAVVEKIVELKLSDPQMGSKKLQQPATRALF